MAASTITIECKRYGCMKNLLACYANCRYTGRCDELRNELADKAAAAETDINRYLSERGRNPILVQILKRGVKFGDRADRSSSKPVKAVRPPAVAATPRLKQNKGASPLRKPPPPPPAEFTGRKIKPPTRTKKAPQAAPLKAKAVAKRRPIIRPAAPSPPRPAEGQSLAPSVSVASRRAASKPAAEMARPRSGKTRSRKRSTMPRRAKPLARANVTANEGPANLTMNAPASQTRPDTAARPSGERVTPRRKALAKSRKSAGAGKVYIILEGQTASIVDEQGLMMHLFSTHSKTTRYFEASEVEARVQIVPKR